MTPDELADLYRRYGPLVHERCEAILRSRDAADDVLQEVFLQVWRYAKAFSQARSQRAWLYTTAHHCCFRHLRRHRRKAEVLEQVAAGLEEPVGEQTLDDRQLIFRFLSHFDDRVKQVAVLYYLDGLTQAEIAEETGWSRQTINKKLSLLKERAQALRQQLTGERGAA
jgi:RNA polymerase sigma-70 factor, ECF subfamily